MERILAINVSRIGDTLLTTPALRALGLREGVVLDVLAHPKRREVLEGLPFIHRLGSITPTRAKWRLLGRQLAHCAPKYDWAVVWGKDEALVRYGLSCAKKVVAHRTADGALNHRLAAALDLPPGGEHAVRQRLAYIAPLGVAPAGLALSYQVSPAEALWADQFLACQPLPAGLRIGLQLKSFHTKSHRDWPLSSFAELIQRFLQRYPEAGFFILGGAESAPEAAAMAARFPGHVVPVAGRLSLRRTAALMSRLNLYVGVDTGPTHLAGALGIPMVALYHSAYPGRYLAPLEHSACVVLEHPHTDHPEAGDAMDAIGVDRVWAGALALLEKTSCPPSLGSGT